jgi:hypothetical protein
MIRKQTLFIPALLATLLAGCSGGTSTPGATGTAAPAPVAAATVGSATTWTSAIWGGGGYVTGLVYHPSNPSVLYARTDVGGAYRWDGSAAKWIPITDGIGWGGGEGRYHAVESLAVDPNNDQLVYIMTGDTVWGDVPGRIYVSSDRGNNWTHYDLPFAVGGNDDGRAYGERLAVDPQNPTTLMYGSRKAGIWKSTDSGKTWNQLTGFSSKVVKGGPNLYGVEQIIFDTPYVQKQNSDPTWIVWATVAPDYAQAAGLTSTLYKSSNGGYSWEPVAVPADVKGFDIPHVAKSADGYFYMTFRTHPDTANGQQAQGMVGPSALYKFGATTGGNGYWKKLNSSTWAGFAGVSVSGSGPTTRIALGVSGTWGDTAGMITQLSDSDGDKWREIEAGMPHPGTTGFSGWNEMTVIDPANRDHIMHVHGGGIGETWNASSNTPTWYPKVVNLEETCTQEIVAAPAGAPYKYINSAGDVGTWVTSDVTKRPWNGPIKHWSNGLTADLAWNDPNYIASVIVDNDDHHILKAYWSGDAGSNWTQFGSLPAGATGSAVQNIVVPSRNNLVWAPPNLVPSYSTNSGATWTATNLPALSVVGQNWDRAYHLAVDRKNPYTVYAYDSGGASWSNLPGKFYISYDNGHTFKQSDMWGIPSLKPSAWNETSMVVNPNAAGDIWLTDGDGLYHSTNGGYNWSKVGDFATNGTKGATKIALGKAKDGASYSATIYVEGTRNGQWGIWQSDDAGVNWTRLNDDRHQFGDSTVLAGDWSLYGRLYVNGAARGIIYSN